MRILILLLLLSSLAYGQQIHKLPASYPLDGYMLLITGDTAHTYNGTAVAHKTSLDTLLGWLIAQGVDTSATVGCDTTTCSASKHYVDSLVGTVVGGGVTSISTSNGILGGTITTTGNLRLDKANIDSVGTLVSGSIGSGFTAIDTARTNAVSNVVGISPISVATSGKTKFISVDTTSIHTVGYNNGRYHTTLFDHYVGVNNSGTSETNLYSDTLAAGQLSSNGDKIHAVYYLQTTASNSDVAVKVYFGATTILNSGDNTDAQIDNIVVDVFIIRVSSTSIRYATSLRAISAGANATNDYQASALGSASPTLANTQVLRITGKSTGNGGDIFVYSGFVEYLPSKK